jgi:hypothetical protein
MKRNCSTCKHKNKSIGVYPCNDCYCYISRGTSGKREKTYPNYEKEK